MYVCMYDRILRCLTFDSEFLAEAIVRKGGWSLIPPMLILVSVSNPQGYHMVATGLPKKEKTAVLGAPSAVSEGMLVPMWALLVYLRTLVQCVWASIFHYYSLL